MDFSYFDNLMGSAGADHDQPADIWVVADRDADGFVAWPTYEVLGLARSLADGLGAYVKAILMGSGLEGLDAELISRGADRVILAEAPELAEFGLEIYTEALAQVFTQQKPEFVLLPSTTRLNELAGRLAGRLNTGLATHCTALTIDDSSRKLVATYPVYDGWYNEVVAGGSAWPQMATVAPGSYPAPYADSWRTGETETVGVELSAVQPAMVSLGPADLPAEELPITRDRVVVAIGRDLGGPEAVDMARQLAQALGGTLAGDRSALDAGYISADRVIGATGLTVAPHLYLALGIRGDTYHQYGMSESQYVIAVHPDPHAPIFRIADMGIVGQPVEVIPALLAQLDRS